MYIPGETKLVGGYNRKRNDIQRKKHPSTDFLHKKEKNQGDTVSDDDNLSQQEFEMPKNIMILPFILRVQLYQKQHQKNMKDLKGQLTKERKEKERADLTFSPKINKNFRSTSPKNLVSYKSEKSLSPEKKDLKFSSIDVSAVKARNSESEKVYLSDQNLHNIFLLQS